MIELNFKNNEFNYEHFCLPSGFLISCWLKELRSNVIYHVNFIGEIKVFPNSSFYNHFDENFYLTLRNGTRHFNLDINGDITLDNPAYMSICKPNKNYVVRIIQDDTVFRALTKEKYGIIIVNESLQYKIFPTTERIIFAEVSYDGNTILIVQNNKITILDNPLS